LTIRAPEVALSEDGKVLPLPKEVEESLVAFVQQRVGRPLDEHRAWQWLIISHNQICGPGRKIALHKRLRCGWSDPLNEGVVRRKRQQKDVIAVLQQQIQDLQDLLKQSVSPNSTAAALIGNGQVTTPDTVEEPKEKVEIVQPSSEEDFPLIMEFHGKECHLARDIDFFEALKGKSARIFSFQNAKGNWAVYVEAEEYDIPVRIDIPSGIIHEVPIAKSDKSVLAKVQSSFPGKEMSQGKAKGKAAAPQLKKVVKEKPRGRSPAPKVQPRSQDLPAGPLRVKNVPRSSVLNEVQKTALKKAFKIDESPISADQWEALSKAEKSAVRKARSLPRWAVQAVGSNPKNLDKVIKGELTADNFRSEVQGPQRPSSPKGKKTPTTARSGKKGRAKSEPRGKPRGQTAPQGASRLEMVLDLLLKEVRR